MPDFTVFAAVDSLMQCTSLAALQNFLKLVRYDTTQALTVAQKLQALQNFGQANSAEFDLSVGNAILGNGITEATTPGSGFGAIGISRTLTLAAISTYALGQVVFIADSGFNITSGGSIVVAANGANTIGGGSFLPTITAPNGWMILQAGNPTDLLNWNVLAASPDVFIGINVALALPAFIRTINGIESGTAGKAFYGNTTLVTGTKVITVIGVSGSGSAALQYTGTGAAITTVRYKAVLTADTLTITALTSADITVAGDVSTLSYIIFQP